MSNTNAAQPQEGQIVQLTWKEVESMQDELKAYRGLVRVLSRDLADAKKELDWTRERVKFLNDLSTNQAKTIGDTLDTASKAVEQLQETRSELARTIRERDALKRQLEERV